MLKIWLTSLKSCIRPWWTSINGSFSIHIFIIRRAIRTAVFIYIVRNVYRYNSNTWWRYENEDDVLCCSLSLIVAFSWTLLLNRSVSFFWPPEVVKIFLSGLYVVEDLLWLQPLVFGLLLVEWKSIRTVTRYLYTRVY